MANIDLRSPAVQKTLLSALLCAGVLAVFFFTHLLPFGYPNQDEKLGVLKADFEKKSTELARARATVADLPRFEAEYETLHQRWAQAAELLPADKQLSVLLRRITLAAQQTGVQFLSFHPTSVQTQQYYTELPMQIAVYGGYHQIGSFLAELSNLRRIVTVSDVKLSVNAKGDALESTSASFTASAFSLNTAPAPPSGKPESNGGARARKS
jgi:type IV pilus assembly protein PilO